MKSMTIKASSKERSSDLQKIARENNKSNLATIKNQFNSYQNELINSANFSFMNYKELQNPKQQSD